MLNKVIFESYLVIGDKNKLLNNRVNVKIIRNYYVLKYYR